MGRKGGWPAEGKRATRQRSNPRVAGMGKCIGGLLDCKKLLRCYPGGRSEFKNAASEGRDFVGTARGSASATVVGRTGGKLMCVRVNG